MAEAVFIDRTGAGPQSSELWEPILVPAEVLAEQIDRLSAAPAPADGRRVAVISHPRAVDGSRGLAPGIHCQLEVLLPGERTLPVRHLASEIDFCLAGSGRATVGAETVDYQQYDTWIHPSMTTYAHENPTTERQVRLTYSNEALLEAMRIHVVDPAAARQSLPAERAADTVRATGAVAEHELIDLDERGSALMSYEAAINPPVVTQEVLHWPWRAVRPPLEELAALGPEYRGRRLYVFYNRATGRTNGTSPTLFASICIRPADVVDRPHRHSLAAINYFFSGHGHSVSGGKTFHWKAGDLMLTAPGWVVHHNASGSEPVLELTVQDQPFTLAVDALLWQEDLAGEIRLLGSHAGFATNRSEVVAATG